MRSPPASSGRAAHPTGHATSASRRFRKLNQLHRTSQERRGRFFGLTAVSETAANARFVTHYNEVFPGDPITRTTSPNSSCDAFSLLAYASYTIPRSEPVTGDQLVRVFGAPGGGGPGPLRCCRSCWCSTSGTAWARLAGSARERRQSGASVYALITRRSATSSSAATGMQECACSF